MTKHKGLYEMLKTTYATKSILPQKQEKVSIGVPVYTTTILFFDMYGLCLSRMCRDIVIKMLNLPLSEILHKANWKIDEKVEIIQTHVEKDYAEAWNKMPKEFKPYLYRIFNKMLFSYAYDFVIEYKLSPINENNTQEVQNEKVLSD